MVLSRTVGTTGNWRRCTSGSNPIAWYTVKSYGNPCGVPPQASLVLNCFGGSTCTPARIGPSLRVGCIPPMDERFLTFTLGLIRFVRTSKEIWVSFLFRPFGGPPQAGTRRKVRPMQCRAGSPGPADGLRNGFHLHSI